MKPIELYGGPQYIVGPQGNKIGVRGGVVGPLPPTLSPIDSYPVVPRPVITHPGPHKKPPRQIRPKPPIRVAPPAPMVQPAPPPRHTWHARAGAHRRRHHPAPLGPPVYVPPVEQPAPVVVAPPIATGPRCPTWGWMVRTNADGSETVIACTPGQPAAAGLHGLDGIGETMASYLGPNWMLYVGLAVGAWYFLKRR